MSRFSFLLICIGSLVSVPAATSIEIATSRTYADWTNNVFPIKTHDFGTVAVASKTEFEFPIYNTLGGEMHIREVRASCGCTTAILKSNTIGVNEKGILTARFNTSTFKGKKGATLTVVIDRPFFSEVMLKVDGYIRSDMVFHPGSVEYGTINQGEAKSGKTKIYYAGRSDWQVVDIRANQPWLIPVFKQVERGPGKATYELTVEVGPDAPAGFFQDEVIVQTNDRQMPNVPLRVSGNVVTALTVSPQSLAFGTLKPGQEVSQRLVLKGREPFVVASIECPGWDVKFDNNEQAKTVHLINLKMSPTTARGPQKASLTIKTAGDSSVTTRAIVTADVQSEQVVTTVQ